jgi:lysophospholipase L1-like esterase
LTNKTEKSEMRLATLRRLDMIPGKMHPQKRWRRTLVVFGAALMVAAGSLYSYDHDAIKGLPVIGPLPWRLLIGNTAVQPAAAHPEPGVVDRRQQQLGETQNRSPQVLFIGDSITDRWLQEGREIWEAQFVPLGAAALGGRGDRIQNLLHRIRSGEFDRFTPHVAVLLIGTNNVNRNTPQEIDEAIDVIVSEFRQRWARAKILVVAIPPRELPRSKEVLRRVSEANKMLARRYASMPDVTFVDDRQAFLASDGWIDSKLYSPEGVHLTAKGYEVLASVIMPTLSAALNSR